MCAGELEEQTGVQRFHPAALLGPPSSASAPARDGSESGVAEAARDSREVTLTTATGVSPHLSITHTLLSCLQRAVSSEVGRPTHTCQCEPAVICLWQANDDIAGCSSLLCPHVTFSTQSRTSVCGVACKWSLFGLRRAMSVWFLIECTVCHACTFLCFLTDSFWNGPLAGDAYIYMYGQHHQEDKVARRVSSVGDGMGRK